MGIEFEFDGHKPIREQLHAKRLDELAPGEDYWTDDLMEALAYPLCGDGSASSGWILVALADRVAEETERKCLTHPDFLAEDLEDAGIDVSRLGDSEVERILAECQETLRLALAESGLRRCAIELVIQRRAGH